MHKKKQNMAIHCELDNQCPFLLLSLNVNATSIELHDFTSLLLQINA